MPKERAMSPYSHHLKFYVALKHQKIIVVSLSTFPSEKAVFISCVHIHIPKLCSGHRGYDLSALNTTARVLSTRMIEHRHLVW